MGGLRKAVGMLCVHMRHIFVENKEQKLSSKAEGASGNICISPNIEDRATTKLIVTLTQFQVASPLTSLSYKGVN